MHPGYVRWVDIPKSFRIGLPVTFDRLVRGWGSPERYDFHGLDGHWVQVKGGPLPVPAVMRIDKSQDGRFIMTGLMIGFHDRREITWETLRMIKPATIISLIFSGFDPKNPAKQYTDTDPAPGQATVRGEDFDVDEWVNDDSDEDPVINLGSSEWREHIRAMSALTLWRVTASSSTGDVEIEEVTKPRASVATNLAEFAEAYQRNYAANPRRATTATAEELHISRATAIRRIDECRRVGLLPRR